MRTITSLLAGIAVMTVSACAADRKAVWPADVTPGGPYSPGVLVDGTLYVAGQLGRDPKTGEFPVEFEAEVRQCLEKVGLVLAKAGMDFHDVVSVNVFLTDVEQFQQMNAVYQTFFTKAPLPARTTIGANKLPGSKGRIEIAVIAHK
jgi:2-iminobutanoate/2-iminopropanoate deaminase